VADDRFDHVSTRADLDRACGGMAMGGPWPRGRFTRVDRSTEYLYFGSAFDQRYPQQCSLMYF